MEEVLVFSPSTLNRPIVPIGLFEIVPLPFGASGTGVGQTMEGTLDGVWEVHDLKSWAWLVFGAGDCSN